MEKAGKDQKSAADILLKISDIRNCFEKSVIEGGGVFDRLLCAYIARGHVLLEGVPGLAKTRAAKMFSEILNTDFSRIQFTPDLLPSDITGNMVFIPGSGEFKVRKGPLFAGVVLADEINRAPAKVQSALLEAMEERQVTIGDKTLSLEGSFFVIATQNPIEHEGTYRLPEAQLDRFLLKVDLNYPSKKSEIEIVELHENSSAGADTDSCPKITAEDMNVLMKFADTIIMKKEIKSYIVDIVQATRVKNKYIEFGASPRASIGIMKCSKIRAMLEGREWATPGDVKEVANDILRHRIIRSFEAEADEITADSIISSILESVKTP